MPPRPIHLLIQICKVILFMWVLSCPVATSAENVTHESTRSPSSPSRLFHLYSPQNLFLHLEFPENLEIRSYKGVSRIDFTVSGNVDIFIVNAEVTEITTVNITSEDGSIYANHIYAKDEGLLYVHINEKSISGKLYTLTVSFVGEIRTDFIGFYLVTYQNDYNESEHVLATNFKPNHARKAFPCLDAPYYRALFNLDVVHSKHYTAVSNREKRRFNIINDSMVHTTFEGTAVIPAYQISLTLMRFKSMGYFRVIDYTAYGRHESCGLALALTASTRFLPDMFYYVLASRQDKFDIVAIPCDKNLIGDNNLNTAVYAEHEIEFRDNEQTVMEQIEIAIRVGRAVAHHHFGFYLAPKTWWDLWLSDAFANWFAYKLAKEIFPYWSVDQFFMVLEYQRALYLDSDDTAISVVPQLTDESTEVPIYSPIFAAKAASILQMLEHGLGSDCFMTKIQNYSNDTRLVTTESFFKSVLEGTQIDPDLLMPWVNQSGYPLVTVIRHFTDNSETVHLKQKPIGYTHSGSTWWIPFNIISKNNPNFERTEFDGFMNPECDMNSSSVKWRKDDWIILNSQAIAFYRINYDPWNWELLTNALLQNHESIHVNNRAQLLDDAFRLAENGILSFDIPLNLSVYLKSEKELAPWSVAYNLFTTLQRLFIDIDEISLLRYYIQQITNEPYMKVGFTESIFDAINLKATRSIITELACQAWNENCFCTARQIFYEFIHNDRPIRPDLRKTVLCTIIGSSSRQHLEIIWKKFFRSHRRTERKQLLYFLGCSKDERFLLEIIQRIFESPPPTDYFQHERNSVIPEIVDKGSVAVLASIKVLQKTFYQKILHRELMLHSTLKKLAENVYTEETSLLFRDLLDNALESKFISPSQYGEYLEKVNKNFKWIYDNHDEVLRWLQHFKDTSTHNGLSVVQEPICEPEIDKICGCGCGCDENRSSIVVPSMLLQILVVLLLFINISIVYK